jgi:hypothetical protein
LSTGFGAGGVVTWLAVRDEVEYRLLAQEGVTSRIEKECELF